MATGFAWFLSTLGLVEPALLFTLGLLLGNLYVAPAIHLLLAFPAGRLASRFDRWLVGITYATVTIGFLPFVFTVDPEASGHCTNCPENLFLIETNHGFAKTSLDLLSAAGVVILLAVLGRLIGRWRHATPPMRRIITPVFVSGAALMAMLALLLGRQRGRVRDHRALSTT